MDPSPDYDLLKTVLLLLTPVSEGLSKTVGLSLITVDGEEEWRVSKDSDRAAATTRRFGKEPRERENLV